MSQGGQGKPLDDEMRMHFSLGGGGDRAAGHDEVVQNVYCDTRRRRGGPLPILQWALRVGLKP